ncbi:mpv17-like protein isoform X1 [Genypterus blacodes]|uniref:mpv17-like protein isoform X1 n=1 Tax=Genypterus blacodes TaxID=154954 RepID=UPI003F758384
MSSFLRYVRRYPWVTNITMFGCLYSGGDVVYQLLSGKDEIDWTHTRNVAIIAFGFHGNVSFFWNRFLERTFPGRAAGMVMRKLLMDQAIVAPVATSVFYTGLSVLEGQEDIMEAWRNKFLNTYKTGLMFWPFVQIFNFTLMPVYLRTPVSGACAFVWGIFLCFSQQKGDGTAAAALAWMFPHRAGDTENLEANAGSIKEIVNA